MAKTQMLFYFESMIIFARNALDIAAYVYGDILFNIRIDSFNKLIKKVRTSNDSLFQDLKKYLESDNSVVRLLCGDEKGRALRDVIIHQANVRMNYYEYKENSEKKHLFLELKGKPEIDIDLFVEIFIYNVLDLFYKLNVCCQKKLNDKT